MKTWRAPILAAVLCALLPALAGSLALGSEAPAGKTRIETNTPSDRRQGLNLNGYLLEKGTIKTGQTLSTLLRPYGVPSAVVLQAVKLSSGVFDARKIKPGHSYTVVRDPGRENKVSYLIYGQSVDQSVIFDLRGPLKVYTSQKPLETQTYLLSGAITTSLWDAIIEQRVDPNLVMRLSELFAIRIVHPGDCFEIIYEEQYAGGKRVALGDIKAAVMTCDGEARQAFQFSHHGKMSYYDETGRNLQKAFLVSPLRYERVSSSFKDRRLHPIKKTYRRHPAIDYAASAGTPVMSVAEGVVSDIGYSKSAGNFIKIDHPGQYASLYMHLSAVADDIKVDAPVGKADIIGFVGSSGLATGAHLDFRFLSKGRYVDYAGVDLPTGEPVDAECLNQFRQRVAWYDTQLAFQRPSDLRPLIMATPSFSEEQPTEMTTSNL